LLANGKVLAVGGRSGLNSGLLGSAELFDPATGLWTATGSLNDAREGQTATLLPSGKVLVAGGDQANSVVLATAELYDPASGQWVRTGTMRNARSDFGATLLADGKVLVAGGFGVEDMPTGVELYDPATGIWTPTIPLITGRRGHSIFRLADGEVVMVGGFNFNDAGASANAELFDPASVAPVPFSLTEAARLPGVAFRFTFYNTPGLHCSVLRAADPSIANDSWADLGQATEALAGMYEFTDSTATNRPQGFYRVRTP